MTSILETLHDLFPEGKWQEHDTSPLQGVGIELEGGYYQLDPQRLSQREALLLQLLMGETGIAPETNPWRAFLRGQTHQAPSVPETIQFFYIDHQFPLSTEMTEMFLELLSGVVALVPFSDHRTIVVIEEGVTDEVYQLLQSLIPTMESDFTMRLTASLGNCWQGLTAEEITALFAEEEELVRAYHEASDQGTCYHFSSLLIWSFQANRSYPAIHRKLSQLIHQQKEMQDVIQALWKHGGNLVQTAQELYIHRNSLQYKLDKFHQLSGLNLKQLDDLASCYLLTMQG